FAKQSLGAKQKEDKSNDVREPVFNRAADERPPIDLAELLAHADDQSAHDGARHRREAAEDQHRQRLERDQREAELHAALGAPHDAGDDRDQPGHRPDDQPDRLERDADRQRGLVIVGHGPQRAADARALEEDREHGHQHGGGGGRGHLELIDLHARHHERPIGDADVELLDVGAPQQLAEALEEEVEADGGHEQDDRLLVHQRPKHDTLDHEREDDHHGHREHERRRHRHAALHQSHQRERREQHHHALREVEDAGGFEDQNEAERDQRVHQAREETAQQHLDQEGGRARHVAEWSDEDRVEDLSHGSHRDRRRAPRDLCAPAPP